MQAELSWQAGSAAHTYVASVSLKNLQPGELLVPSLSLVTNLHYGFQCSLTAGPNKWSLAGIATDAALGGQFPAEQNALAAIVSTHLDVFAIHQPLATAQLEFELQIAGITLGQLNNSAPDYLAVVSRRAAELSVQLPTSARPSFPVPSISQMSQPSRQRLGTCSPTAVSMLMAAHSRPFHPAFIDACKHSATGMFGVWPLNVIQASRRGFIGAVELFSCWDELASSPDPFIASIRFGKDELQGAPLPATTGHLVVVRGTTNTEVLCSDPAAATAAEVPRTYDLTEFSRAWLSARGAAYVLHPFTNTTPTDSGQGEKGSGQMKKDSNPQRAQS